MAQKYKSWPFKEAMRLEKSFGREAGPEEVIFQTGFGPSGLPHLGTFAEIARTTWGRKAFEHLSGDKTRLFAFGDDLDGLRKVPDNLPNQEMLTQHLAMPLRDIPDPYGCCDSFSGHMIGKLAEFLDTFGFDYEIKLASESYRNGVFDHGLEQMLDNVDKILEIILPTLKEENRKKWSPFLPTCEKCKRIYTTRVVNYRTEERALDYVCDGEQGAVKGCGHEGTVSVLGGATKMGWKMDWALRWYCFGINYEMYGKDLIPSAELSQKIVRTIGGRPPIGFFYELFLDEQGEKISKSKGNGVSVDEWLAYAPVESLAYYVFKEPRQAKKLYSQIIPRTMDEYLDQLRRFDDTPEEKRPDKPLWHIHDAGSSIPPYGSTINFTMVGNLISALGNPEVELVKRFLTRYDENSGSYPEIIDGLIEKGLRYYEDFILPGKHYRDPSDDERPLFAELESRLREPGVDELEEKALQAMVFDIARAHEVEPKEFFAAIYQVLLGQERGPRFGSFAKLVGSDRILSLIQEHVGN